MEHFAIMHDGSMDGDNIFYALTDVVNVTGIGDGAGNSFERMLGLYGEKLDDEGWDAEEITEQLSEVKGAWIVTQETIDLMGEVADAVDPGSDSLTYALNRALKAIARKQAVHTVGEDAV